MTLMDEKNFWESYFEKRFLELSYRVMKNAGIQSVIIDDGAGSGRQDSKRVHLTSSANKATILIEMVDSVAEPYFYDEYAEFDIDAFNKLQINNSEEQ